LRIIFSSAEDEIFVGASSSSVVDYESGSNFNFPRSAQNCNFVIYPKVMRNQHMQQIIYIRASGIYMLLRI
jgi:hypothetical protein